MTPFTIVENDDVLVALEVTGSFGKDSAEPSSMSLNPGSYSGSGLKRGGAANGGSVIVGSKLKIGGCVTGDGLELLFLGSGKSSSSSDPSES